MSVALAGKAKEHRHASQLSTPSSHCFLVWTTLPYRYRFISILPS
jgi:hypothetical protein